MSVHKKLMQARVRLQSMPLKKSGLNKFAGYSYFELGDFLPQTQQIFDSLGLCGVISFTPEVATLTITDTEDGSQIVITSPMSEANLKGCHPVQSLGAVETYQRRYLWVTAMEIVEHDALDAVVAAPQQERKDAGGTISAPRLALEALPADWRAFLEGLAPEVVNACEQQGPQAARDLIDSHALEQDHIAALWALLPSKVRSAIKALTADKQAA